MKYENLEVTNAISLEMGEKLVKLKKEGKLPKINSQDILTSVKIAQMYYERKKKELRKAKKRKEKWFKIGKKLGVIDE